MTGTSPTATTAFRVRAFQESDRAPVVDLLRRVLDRPGGHPHDDAFFRWKHLENPYGRSFMMVADAGGRIVGFRAIMRWKLRIGGEVVQAGRPVDTVTDPGLRRQGVFSALTMAALDQLEALGIKMLFNTPNAQSLPGYLKMGWTPLGRAVRDILVGGPLVLASWAVAGLGRNGAFTQQDGESGQWGALAAGLRGSESGVAVAKTEAYLRWRYAQHPWYRYRVADSQDVSGVFRVARGPVPMAIVAESTAGEPRQWRGLCNLIARQAAAPVLQFVRTAPSQRPVAGLRWMHMARPGPVVVARPTGGEPLDPRPWYLTTGELEFF